MTPGEDTGSAVLDALAVPQAEQLVALPRMDAAAFSPDGRLMVGTYEDFDGDPLVSGTIEGPIPLSAVKTTTLHDDPVGYQARGLTVPYRALTYDYVLRPTTSAGSLKPWRTALR